MLTCALIIATNLATASLTPLALSTNRNRTYLVAAKQDRLAKYQLVFCDRTVRVLPDRAAVVAESDRIKLGITPQHYGVALDDIEVSGLSISPAVAKLVKKASSDHIETVFYSRNQCYVGVLLSNAKGEWLLRYDRQSSKSSVIEMDEPPQHLAFAGKNGLIVGVFGYRGKGMRLWTPNSTQWHSIGGKGDNVYSAYQERTRRLLALHGQDPGYGDKLRWSIDEVGLDGKRTKRWPVFIQNGSILTRLESPF